MPHIVTIRARQRPIDRFLNIDQGVGDDPKNANAPADVRVVQQLMEIGVSNGLGAVKFPPPGPSGTFDAVTSYYIYHLQRNNFRAGSASKVDGVVSKAINAVNYGGGLWSIIVLNEIAAKQNRVRWEALLSGFQVRGAM